MDRDRAAVRVAGEAVGLTGAAGARGTRAAAESVAVVAEGVRRTLPRHFGSFTQR